MISLDIEIWKQRITFFWIAFDTSECFVFYEEDMALESNTDK